jgi:uncharacterized protein YqgQ
MSEINILERLLAFGVLYSKIYFTCRLIQNKQAEHFTAFAQNMESDIECMYEEVEKMARKDRFQAERFNTLFEKLKLYQNQCNKHVVKMASFGNCIFH